MLYLCRVIWKWFGLILVPMLASQPCSHAFWVLTSLHFFYFYRKCFLLFFFSLFFFWMVWIFIVDCKNTGVSYIISWNHTIIIIFIKICSSMKSVFLYISIFFFTYRWCPFSISLTALSAVQQEVIVSTIQYSNDYHSILYYYTMA